MIRVVGLRPGRRATAGFVLLEVIVSMVILGVSLATLMRSFTLSMNAIRRNDITTQGCVLCESLLQDLEVRPPSAKVTRGTFEDQGFPQFSYEVEYEEETIRYKGLKTTANVRDLKPLRLVRVTVWHEGRFNREPVQVAQAHLYLAPIERFSYQSKFLNELFKEER